MSKVEPAKTDTTDTSVENRIEAFLNRERTWPTTIDIARIERLLGHGDLTTETERKVTMSGTTSNTETPSPEMGTLTISNDQLRANQLRLYLHEQIWYKRLPDWMKCGMVGIEYVESSDGLLLNSVIGSLERHRPCDQKTIENTFAAQLAVSGAKYLLSSGTQMTSALAINDAGLSNKTGFLVGTFLRQVLAESGSDCCLTDPFIEHLVQDRPGNLSLHSTRHYDVRKKMVLLHGDRIKLSVFAEWIGGDFHTFCKFSMDPSKTKLTVINF